MDLWQILTEFPILERRLWRMCGLRTAVTKLAKQPKYQVFYYNITHKNSFSIQDWPTSKLSLMCECSYVEYAPEGPVPTFDITDDMREVVVISGEVRCVSTRERFIESSVIPKTVKQLLMNVGSPKLLVITNEKSDDNQGEKNELDDGDRSSPKLSPIVTLYTTFSSAVISLWRHVQDWLSRTNCYRNRVKPAGEEKDESNIGEEHLTDASPVLSSQNEVNNEST